MIKTKPIPFQLYYKQQKHSEFTSFIFVRKIKNNTHFPANSEEFPTCTSCFEQELVARGTWPSSPEKCPTKKARKNPRLAAAWGLVLLQQKKQGSNLYIYFPLKKMVSFYYWVEPFYHVEHKHFHIEIWGESLQNGKFQWRGWTNLNT